MSHNTTLLIIKPPNDPWKEISRPLNVHKVQPVQLLLTSVTARHVLNNRCFPVWVDIQVCKFAACKLDELFSSTPQGLYRIELERKGHPCLAIQFKCNQAKIVQLIPLIQSYKQSCFTWWKYLWKITLSRAWCSLKNSCKLKKSQRKKKKIYTTCQHRL